MRNVQYREAVIFIVLTLPAREYVYNARENYMSPWEGCSIGSGGWRTTSD